LDQMVSEALPTQKHGSWFKALLIISWGVIRNWGEGDKPEGLDQEIKTIERCHSRTRSLMINPTHAIALSRSPCGPSQALVTRLTGQGTLPLHYICLPTLSPIYHPFFLLLACNC
jgi:hypothetical protein